VRRGGVEFWSMVRGGSVGCGTGRAPLIVWVAALLWSVTVVEGAERFPQPEFESGYVQPATTGPCPRSDVLETLDLAVLLAAIGLASYLALRARSRRGMTLLAVFCLLYFGFWRKGCVCSVGSLQNVALAVANGEYRIPLTVLAFFLVPLFTTLLFGRTFCAAVCPLGAVQDLVVLRPVRVPFVIDRLLRLLPVVYLGVAVFLAATGTGFVVCRWDPFVGLFRLSGEAYMIVLGFLFVALGLVVGRPYCRYVCPYGVLLGWASRLSGRHVTITPDECVECGLCADSCPFGAIRAPVLGRVSEPRRIGVRRLAILLALCPLLIAGGGWLGFKVGHPLSRLHRSVRLAEQLRAEESDAAQEMTVETLTFRSTGGALEGVYAEGLAKQGQFAKGGWVLGGALGLVFFTRLVALSVRRERHGCEPDRGSCFSCGRCFAACPRERLRLKERSEP